MQDKRDLIRRVDYVGNTIIGDGTVERAAPNSTFFWETAASGSVFFEEFLYFESGHASATRRGDGLAIAAILHIAAGINAMDASVHVVVRFEIPVGVSIELSGKYLRVGLVTDAEKQSAGGEVPDFPGLHVAQP